MKKHLFFYSALSLLLTGLLASCHYKDFDEDYDTDFPVKFVYDYSSLDFQPKMMRLVTYPLEGQFSTPLVRDFADSTTIDMPSGNYRLAAFNNDSGILRYSGYDSLDGNIVITTGLADKVKTAMLDTIPGAEFYDYPDRLAFVSMDSVNIPQSLAESHTIILTPHEATQQVHVTIEGLRNLQLLQQTELCLDNCYVAFTPERRCPDTKTAYVVSPDVSVDATNKLLTGTFNIFGMPTEDGHTLRVAISGIGFRHVLKFNLNGRIGHRQGSRDIWINLKTDFDIDGLVKKGGTFDIDVDEWKTDSAEIQL